MEQYKSLLDDVISNGEWHENRTGVRTLCVFGRQQRFDLTKSFPLLTLRSLAFKIIVEEMLWFLSGSTRVNRLRERKDAAGNPIKIWDAWAATGEGALPAGDLGPIYGHQWRNFNATDSGHNPAEFYDEAGKRWINWPYAADGFDQIAHICEELTHNPESRRMIVSAWNPMDIDDCALPPCHVLFHLKYHKRTNKLDLHLFQRSCDIYLGVPYNIASYALLLCLLATCFDMTPGEFVHTYSDLHLYETHLERAMTLMTREPVEVRPQLRVNPALRGKGFDGVVSATWQDFELSDYLPHPALTAPVVV